MKKPMPKSPAKGAKPTPKKTLPPKAKPTPKKSCRRGTPG